MLGTNACGEAAIKGDLVIKLKGSIMSVAQFAVAQASLAENASGESVKRTPPSRTVKALKDQKLAPEVR